jgi:hypothetical protein
MNNAASTPEFKRILKAVYHSGKVKTSGEALSEAWRVYRKQYPEGAQYHERSGPEQRKRATIKATFRNPREMRPRIKVSKRKRRGKLGARSPLKGYKINRQRRSKIPKNPIAIYNPRSGTKLPASNIEIRYRRVGGEYNGQWFRHPYKSASLVGLPDGNVLIKSNSGKRLWGSV